MNAALLSAVHHEHIAALRSQPAILDEEGLRIGGQYVMFFAEADLMRQHALRLITAVPQPDLLEVGLGLGVFAAQLARMNVGSYTAIEPHQQVARLAEQRVLQELDNVTVIAEPWQLASLPADAYDAIMYDTWPPHGHADSDFAAFVKHVAVRCLRPGGRFSFFHSGSTINDSRRQTLDRHFAGWTAHAHTMPAEQTPPHWTKPTRDFLIPIAVKGGR